jgi:hypothetical protein
MRLKPHIPFILLVSATTVFGSTVVTDPTNPVGTPQALLYTRQTWGYAYLTVTGMMILSLFFSWLMVMFVARRRIEEAKMRRSLIMLLSLGLGFLFGCSVIQLLPKAFGS